MDATQIVRARPHPATALLGLVPIGLAVMAVLSAVFPDSKGERMSWTFAVVVGTLFLASLVPLAYWLLAHEITADADGLRWRERRTWRCASWSEVADYGIVPPTSGGYASSHAIDLADGTRLRFGNDWRNHQHLQDAVRSRANATETGEWEHIGVRTRDLPRAFAYDAARMRRELRSAHGGLAFLGLFFAGLCLATGWQSHQRGTGDAPSLLIIASMMPVPLLWVAWQTARDYRDAFARAGEMWTLEREGFRFRAKDGSETAVLWEEVIGYDFQIYVAGTTRKRREPLRIAASDGRAFSFDTRLTDAGFLVEIVRRRAVKGVETKIDYESAEARGGVAALWTGGVEGVGARVFHARTRSNRFLIWLPSVFLAVLSVGFFSHSVSNLMLHARGIHDPDLMSSGDSRPGYVVLAVAATLLLAGEWLRRTVRVVVDDRAIRL